MTQPQMIQMGSFIIISFGEIVQELKSVPYTLLTNHTQVEVVVGDSMDCYSC